MSETQTRGRNERKVKIVRTTIPKEKEDKIMGFLHNAMDKFTMDKDVATEVKKNCDLDAALTGTWHVVVGRNFGCSITHDTKYVLFVQVDQTHCLIFKSLE